MKDFARWVKREDLQSTSRIEGILRWVVQEMTDGGEGDWEPPGLAQIREDGDIWKELNAWVGK